MIRWSAVKALSLPRHNVLVPAGREVFRIQSLSQSPHVCRSRGAMSARALSSKPGNEEKKKEGDESTTDEIVLTPGEKVVAATRLGWYLGLAGFAAACAYFIGKELIPT